MILIDSREGSKEMVGMISEGILAQLEFGDACFEGKGPDGNITVGVERKRVGDLLNSIATGRLSGHQIPGMLETYDKSYLIVEGKWRGNKDTGYVEEHLYGRKWRVYDRGRKFKVRDVWSYLTTIENVGVTVRITADLLKTCQAIEFLFHWWNKGWMEHKSHLALHKGGVRRDGSRSMFLNPMKPSLVRRIAEELPGVGFDRALAVERKFESVRSMFEASEEEWRNVEGIGKVTAKTAWEALHIQK